MQTESTSATRRAWRRPLSIGAALLVTAGASVGFTMAAQASGGPSTTNVQFLPLSPPFKLFTNHSFAANASFSAVVIGGSTTVPTNATTVELTVEAGGSSAGTMNFLPAGSFGGSGQSLSWAAGSTAQTTIQENVGTKNELTFALSGGAAKATATIIGYSTQVTDGDVSGLDGTAGQVLTDNGTGGSWENPSVSSGDVNGAGGSAGQVLTNDGSGGASWQSPPKKTAYTSAKTSVALPSGYDIVDSVTVPAGVYSVSDTLEAHSINAVDVVECAFVSPAGAGGGTFDTLLSYPDGTIYYGTMTGTAVVNASTGGKITFECRDIFGNGTAVVNTESLIATQIDAVSGPEVG